VELGADIALTPSDALLRQRGRCYIDRYAIAKTINLALNLVKA